MKPLQKGYIMKAAYSKYIAALLLFGLNGIVASHIALNSCEIVFTRSLIGSVFLVLLFLLTRKKGGAPVNKTHLMYLMASGVSMGASWMFLYEAYDQVGVGVATLSCYCGPVIVMALSPLLFGERITWSKAAGFVCVLLGMLFVNLRVLNGGKNLWGVFCGIMSAAMYAAMVIFNKKAESIRGLRNAMWQMVAAFAVVAVFLCLRQGLVLHIEPNSVLPILVLGIVNTGIGCYLYFSAIIELPVQSVAVCGYLEPLSAVFFAALLLGESMNALQIFGGALILGGAAFAELYKPKRLGIEPDV